MQSLLQRGQDSRQPMLWMRLVAALCIVMVAFMSAAQACHTHAEAASLKQNSHQNQPAPEDHCLVCVAMHSALPAALHISPEPPLNLEPIGPAASDTLRTFRWRFEMASRGPPADQKNAFSI